MLLDLTGFRKRWPRLVGEGMVIAMKLTKIKSALGSFLIAGLVVSSIGAGVAEDKKPEAPKVTLEELAKEPAKFQGKLIQVEGLSQETQVLQEKQGEFAYRLVIGKNNVLLVWCAGKLTVSKGDTVRITGEFRHQPAATHPFNILAAGKSGKVEKAGFEQKPGTPLADQLKALTKEYQDLVDAHEKAFQNVKDEAQRIDYWKNYPPPERLYPRLLALAQKHPKDAAAVDALIWVVMHQPIYYGPDPKDQEKQRKVLETRQQALDLLLRDHLASEKLPLVFPANEKFLRAVLEKSPHRPIRGLACYTLAEQRIQLGRRVIRVRNEISDWRQRWDILPKQSPYVTTDLAKLTKETEALLEQVVRDFADVPIEERRNGKTLGELAKRHLHEIRHLAIGMPAPALKSVDLDGKPVQLADLKGKVVVLDVWAVWCGPCRAMIPHQRALVKRLDGKPFALVSISVDEKRATLAAFLKKEPMPWTHWHEGPDGKIIADLNVCSYPTIYVLDAKGVIRHKDVRGQFLDQAVDALLKEVGEKSPRQ